MPDLDRVAAVSDIINAHPLLILGGIEIVASDRNPGSSPVGSLRLMLNMACTLFRMTPEEALAGVTRVAAQALGLAESHGTLEVGKVADFAIFGIWQSMQSAMPGSCS